MKPFHCDHCGGLVFFESTRCVQCGHALGFVPAALDLSALAPAEGGLWRPLAPGAVEGLYRSCPNGLEHGVCNWLVPVESADTFCVACRLNRTIPDLAADGNRERWHRLEKAKRRLVYTFLRLGLPLDGPNGDRAGGLQFEFLGDAPGGAPVLTGHQQGVITVNVAEADDVERERRRVHLHEPFRTLLGHFRHEASHYLWDRLISGGPRMEGFRQLFGDETVPYAEALAQHYTQGPPADWATRFITGYASSHPWEDWAESCAHYFHMVDTLETAAGFGLSLRPRHPDAGSMTVDACPPEPAADRFDGIIEAWAPLTVALNSLNRSMGQPDLYPFVLTPLVVEKLRFIHETLATTASLQK